MLLDNLIKKYKAHEIDFVLPDVEGDIPLYLDLCLLYDSPDQRWHKVQALIYKYFNFYLQKYRENLISEHNLLKFLEFPEVAFIALGYCKKGFFGSGGAKDRAFLIKKEIFDNETIQRIGIEAIAKMAITVASIGPDILSDLVANFAVDYLLDYTHEQVKIFNLDTAEFQIKRSLNPEIMKWHSLPIAELPCFKNGEPRVLVPKHLVRKLPMFSTTAFYKNFLRFVLKHEEEDSLVSIYRTIGKTPKVPFKQIEEDLKKRYGTLTKATRIIARRRPELIKKYVEKPALYEDLKRKRKKKEDIDWNKYINNIKEMPKGVKYAKDYAELVRKVFTALYGDNLVNGTLEEKSLDNLFYYDISFGNAVKTPLFRVINNQGIVAGILIIEVKNYEKSKLSNKEFNQSLGYTVSSGRELIFLVTRKKISTRDIERSRRAFLSHKVLIFPLSDEDVIKLIYTRSKDPERFDEVLIPRLKKILEA